MAVTVRCTHQVPHVVIDSGRPHSNIRAHGLETAHCLVLHMDSHSLCPVAPYWGKDLRKQNYINVFCILPPLVISFMNCF